MTTVQHISPGISQRSSRLCQWYLQPPYEQLLPGTCYPTVNCCLSCYCSAPSLPLTPTPSYLPTARVKVFLTMSCTSFCCMKFQACMRFQACRKQSMDAHAQLAGSEPALVTLSRRSSSSGAGPLAVHTSSSSSDASVDVGEHLLQSTFLASVSCSLSLYSASDSGAVAAKGTAGLGAGLAARASKGGGQRGGAAGRKRKGQRELPKQERELEELRQQVSCWIESC